MDASAIARVCHEANRALCHTMGDDSHEPWTHAPEWQRVSVLSGVTQILKGEVGTPEQSHLGWLATKKRDGWVWGPVKDPAKKQHPCMVDYAKLPPDQQKKDALFFAIVAALR